MDVRAYVMEALGRRTINHLLVSLASQAKQSCQDMIQVLEGRAESVSICRKYSMCSGLTRSTLLLHAGPGRGYHQSYNISISCGAQGKARQK